MRIFSDEMREWAEYTYEVFVPEQLRSMLFHLTRDAYSVEIDNVGEFTLTSRRFSRDIEHAQFVPDDEPVREWNVPLEVLQAVMDAETYQDVEQLLINADEHSVLLDGGDGD